MVRELCRRVDGLPLAVELAAARVRALRPQDVLDRLTERLSFLAGGPHDLPARQQTLYETLDWSYDLLPEEERGLLAGLSVFRGGATLAAVAEVCLAGDEGGALDRIERLADASLLLVRRPAGETRYDLLEVVRQYAADRLDELGADSDEEPSRRVVRGTGRAGRAGAERRAARRRGSRELEAEHDNMRAALAYFAETGEHEHALRLTVLLSRFWYVRGHLAEARRRLEAVLPSAVDQDPNLLRRAQTAGASIALLQGDYAASTAFAERALDSARRTGEPKFVAQRAQQPRRDRPGRRRRGAGGDRAGRGPGTLPARSATNASPRWRSTTSATWRSRPATTGVQGLSSRRATGCFAPAATRPTSHGRSSTSGRST